MTMETKKNIFKEHLAAWLAAKGNKRKRGEIIRHICFVAGAHPKSIPRSFKRVQMRDPAIGERRGRKTYYTPDVIAALKEVWEIASEPCGENLHAVIAEYVAILIRDGVWNHSEDATRKLRVMSLGMVKKRVAMFSRRNFLMHGKSTTKSGAIHTLIPIRTGPWDAAPIGTEQIDTVAHCGGSVAGTFVYTVNGTDVPSLWGTRRAQWNKGQEQTVASMEQMDRDAPFPVLEWHPDSGAEFINWHCKGWAEKRGQMLTRSRPSHKNDNCFVEERNGHVVRRWVGHARFDAIEVVGALNSVYDVLTPYLNHFVASLRTVSKMRVGATWKIEREKMALTPYQRILMRNDVSAEVKEQIKLIHQTLSPLILTREIDRRLKKVFDIQKRYGMPKSDDEFR